MKIVAAFAHWRTALIAGLVLGIVFGLIEGFSIFSLAFARDLGIERGQASGMYATYLLASTVSAPVAGRLVDRFGPRRVILTAFPLLSVGIGLCSRVTELWQAYVIYITLIATATSVLIVASQVIVNNSYSKDRGKALGTAYACVGLGDFTLFSVLGVIVEHMGWRTAYLVAAAVATFGGVLFFVLARPLSSAQSVVEETQPLAQSAPIGRTIVQPAFWFLFGAAFAASVLDFVVFQHTVPFLVTAGYTDSKASFMLGLASLGYIAGQLGAGVLSDRFGRESIGTCAAVVFALGLTVIWVLPPMWLIGIGAAVLGLSVGGVIGCRNAALGDLFAGTNLGRVSGMIQVASAVGAAFGTWIGGFGFDLTGSYDLTFSVAVGCAVAWTAALWFAAPRRAQEAVRHTSPPSLSHSRDQGSR